MSDIRGDQAKHVFSRKTANTALEGKLVEKRRKHGENEQRKMRDIVKKKVCGPFKNDEQKRRFSIPWLDRNGHSDFWRKVHQFALFLTTNSW